MIVARRVYLYGIAFAALWMLAGGLAGLLEILLTVLAERFVGPIQTVAQGSFASEVSYSGALIGIGLLVWLIHWGLALRITARDEIPERRSGIRKLYLYAVLLVGGVVLVYQGRGLLIDVLRQLFGVDSASDLLTGSVLPQLSRVLTIGVLWAYHAKIARDDARIVPEAGAGATLRRWCVYVLATIGLLLLIVGTVDLLQTLFDRLAPTGGQVIAAGQWQALGMAGQLSSTTVGLGVWLAAWVWSTRLFYWAGGPAPERDSVLRKVYLYGVLLMAVSWTVWNLGQMLYVALRSALIPAEAGDLWGSIQDDLGESIANLLVFGVVWAYHAAVLRREAAAATEVGRQASIRWIYGYIVALVGSATLAGGLIGLLMTVLDLIVQPNSEPFMPYWWQRQVSLYATLALVGLPVWLIPWRRLQSEVVASVARRSLVRRIYLFVALASTVLTLLGACVFVVYQVLRAILGESWTASNTSDVLHAGSAAAVAGLFLAYHLQVFRRDAALAEQDAAATPATVTPAASLVTLLVIRAGSADEAEQLRNAVTRLLPNGTAIQTVRMPPDEADRLLSGT
ncbi:MAG: hypothetical protein IT306_20690 [Chloroflexi bacterium]|nr:hypothetical protein [Chloroflexota bacterium]